ncbi:MAG: WbqC family protein [Balneolaceae bacterium]
MRSIAVMQPYFFPYIGYFQLIEAVDEFVFYDDVNYIKSGWINRNKILINGQGKLITIPCSNASQNKLILEVKHNLNEREIGKLLKKIKYTYSKAPYFEAVYGLVESVLDPDTELISEIAIESILKTAEYLNVKVSFIRSSEYFDNQSLDAADRLIEISKKRNFDTYINSIGGQELYDKEYFNKHGLDLFFLEPNINTYKQFNTEFVGGLSILDVMMFESPEKIKEEFLNNYKLI